MWTKKIEIKDENHLKEVVKALESMGETMWRRHFDYPSVKSFWYDDVLDCWYSDDLFFDKNILDEDVPEFKFKHTIIKI